MKLLAPVYYQKFKCIAERCTHSCCVGWEIDVDAITLEKYRHLPAPLGEEIRASIKEGADGAHFTLRPDGRCPHLDDRGLCRIITALGEGALCDICREHPRFYNRVGDHAECGIGASCEAAAELILSSDDYAMWVEIGNFTQEREAPADFDLDILRAKLFTMLGDRTLSYARREALIEAECHISSALSKREYHTLLSELEYLDAAHEPILAAAFPTPIKEGTRDLLFERLLGYFIYRHASTAKTRREFDVLVGVSLLLVRLFAALLAQGELTPVSAAVLLSEELEYSQENLAAVRFAIELHNI